MHCATANDSDVLITLSAEKTFGYPEKKQQHQQE
jgi:hypothetical protein